MTMFTPACWLRQLWSDSRERLQFSHRMRYLMDRRETSVPETRADREHEYGHIRTYTVESGDVLVLDGYNDQYSLTWSTNIEAATFVSMWSRAGAEKARMLIHLVGSEGPLEGYGYQLFDVVRNGQRWLKKDPIALIRLWFPDVSVTWQLLPTSQAAVGTVVGVASDRVDARAITSYFWATATPSIQETVKHIPELLSELHLTSGNLSTLRYAAEVGQQESEQESESEG